MGKRASLNLAELAAYPAAVALPAAGWVLFFYDAQEQPWGSAPADRGRAVVRYQPAATVLTPRPLPVDLSTETYTAYPGPPWPTAILGRGGQCCNAFSAIEKLASSRPTQIRSTRGHFICFVVQH